MIKSAEAILAEIAESEVTVFASRSKIASAARTELARNHWSEYQTMYQESRSDGYSRAVARSRSQLAIARVYHAEWLELYHLRMHEAGLRTAADRGW